MTETNTRRVRITDGTCGEIVDMPDGQDPDEFAAETAATWLPDDVDVTTWVHIAVFDEDEDGEFTERIGAAVVAIDPPEPPCRSESGHDWAPHSTSGHGGGVRIAEACEHCGRQRVTDTWTTDPATGEQGTSVSYA